MALSNGTRLGSYEIVSPIGAGGMGEVYRARDTRLDRIVAIKVLPSHLSDNPELRQRFDREARAVSSLSHSHICTLYDIGNQDGVDYLVMEYLEGETLADKLAKGALPLDQALRYAVEMADALDKAHRQGLVHRDLKPGNIMLTKSGSKLLDFGLAKQLEAPKDSMLSALPTKQKPLTDDGVIPGTLQYMAPEQLEGKEADTRADIFSFGVVVYEMVTGRRAFEGKSPASLIASILEHEPPPVSKLQPSSPPTLDRVVKTCMAKDPDERWQSACDLRRELEWIKDDGSRAEVSVPVVGRHRHREQLLAAGLVLFGVIAVALAVPYFFRAPADEQVARFDIPVPQEVSIYSLSRIALSPDGRHVAWQSAADHALWLRSLDTLEVRKMPGTDGGDRPFWSPDSRFIGFFSDGKLKTVDISGGQPRTICDARGQNATWSGEGWILFSEGGNLHRVAVGGGEPPAPVAPDPSLQEQQRDYPHFLPDGRHFLFHGRDQDSGDSAIYLGSLEGGAPRRLLSTDFQATYAPPGYILFMRDGNLMCQQFDVRRFELSGESSLLAEQVAFSPAYGAQFSVSGNGVLAYRPRDRATELVWLDRGGRLLEVIGEEFAHLDLSADEKRVAVSRIDGRTGNWDVWLLDFERGLESRFTFDPSQDNYPLWSPDGSRIVFHSRRDGPHKLYTKSVMGTGKAELLAEFDVVTIPYDWSSDGRFLVFTKGSGTARDSDLWVLPLLDNGEPFPFLETEFHLTQPQISPDGRWLAYVSDESGSYEVYVRRFPRAGGQWQISNGGGVSPRWSHDGQEIFYIAPDRNLVAVAVAVEDDSLFEIGSPEVLFETRIFGGGTGGLNRRAYYDVTADGERILMQMVPESQRITVVLNWTEELEQ